MTWLYQLPLIALFLVLSFLVGAVAAGLWWLPKVPEVFPLVRAGKGVSPVIQGVSGTLFVLATTFLASSVWTAEDRAYDAVAIEAREVRQLQTLGQFFAEPRRSELATLVSDYAAKSAAEWPLMEEEGGSREAEQVLIQLYAVAVAPAANEQMLAGEVVRALNELEEARQRRLDIARNHVSADQWLVMLILALILAVTVTFVHAGDEGGRAIALGLVAVMVTTSLFILVAHDRPFIGWAALGPEPVIEAGKGS